MAVEGCVGCGGSVGFLEVREVLYSERLLSGVGCLCPVCGGACGMGECIGVTACGQG